MTSLRQIEANRRNALKSTGPTSANGKHASRRNALRLGFTAETVLGLLENLAEYRTFEAAILSCTCPNAGRAGTRFASLFWRLRRATSIETGLLRLQSEILLAFPEVPPGGSALVRSVRPTRTAPRRTSR